MLRLCSIAFRCSNATATIKPCRGFIAIKDPAIRAEVLALSNPKLQALAEVLKSLNNAQTEYLNLLLAQSTIDNNKSILTNKIISANGHTLQPIEYFYQQDWIKKQWKDMQLLQFIVSEEHEEAGEKIEVQAIREHYDVQLTSLDAAQKIKAIKTLRELFNLGLKEAKDLADKTPSMIKKNMKREEAEKLKKDLEAVGCVINLK